MSANLKAAKRVETTPLEPSLDPALHCQIEALTKLGTGVVREIEILQVLLATGGTNSCPSPHEPQLNSEMIMRCEIDFYAEIRRYEIALIKTALRQARGSQTRAAKLLHMKITTLNSKIKHYGIHR